MASVGNLVTTQTWTAIQKDLKDELKKWQITDYRMPYKGDSEQAGSVTLVITINGTEKTIQCSKFSDQENGPERNLAAIKQVIRATRLADQRGIAGLLADVATLVALPEFEPWRILGVAKDSPYEVARKAYLRKIQEYHPDKQAGSQMMFDIIQKAGLAVGVQS